MRVIITNHVAHAPSIICLISNAEYIRLHRILSEVWHHDAETNFKCMSKEECTRFQSGLFFSIVILVGLW